MMTCYNVQHKKPAANLVVLLMVLTGGGLCIDVTCDFEVDMCGWNQSVSSTGDGGATWERHQGATTTMNTGPASGHGGEDSWYMFVDGSKSVYDAQAVLVSPYVFNHAGKSECYFFSFWYHMSGEDVGSLSVLLDSRTTGMKEALWHQNAQRGNGWNKGGVQFTESGHFRLYMIAKRGSGPLSDIAIDDLRLAKSYCGAAEHPKVVTDYFECNNGRLISTDLYCDGEDQCEDGSDEDEQICMHGAFNLDALTIVGIIILMLLICILIVLLVVICHRRRLPDNTKPRPHHTARNDEPRGGSGGGGRSDHCCHLGDRRPPGYCTANGTSANRQPTHCNGTPRPAVCSYEDGEDANDTAMLTQCDDLSPTHIRMGAPPPYSIVDEVLRPQPLLQEQQREAYAGAKSKQQPLGGATGGGGGGGSDNKSTRLVDIDGNDDTDDTTMDQHQKIDLMHCPDNVAPYNPDFVPSTSAPCITPSLGGDAPSNSHPPSNDSMIPHTPSPHHDPTIPIPHTPSPTAVPSAPPLHTTTDDDSPSC